MSTTLCPYCGNPVRIGAAFCPVCGRTLPTTQSLIAAPLEPGMMLNHDRYRIEKRLGKGGAGDVYLARDTKLFNRPVVVKRLRVQETDAKDRADAEHNFQREAQALAELNNPRFPQVLDFFVDPPMLYLVMEFVAGKNLQERLDALAGPMSEDQVRDIGLQMAELLIYLHGQEEPIVHRDVKPGNIMMNDAGQITLVDFGIARSKSVKGDGKGGPKADSVAWGTPGYAPPEQVAGRTEPASDIYALGATLHQLVTGRDPRDHVNEPFPPANELNPTVSTVFSDLLRWMLATAPGDRPTATVLQTELRNQDTLARYAKTSGHLSAVPVTAPPPVAPVPAPPAPRSPGPGGQGAFIFPNGDTASDAGEWARQADRNWLDARAALYDGRVVRWLRNTGQPGLAANATAITSSEPNQDLGLEAFLQQAQPGLPSPRLNVHPPTIEVGPIRPGGRTRQILTIENTGRGAMRARLRPSAGWIMVNPAAVTLRERESADIEVIISPPTGNLGHGQIEVSAGGAGNMTVAVEAATTGAQMAPATTSSGGGGFGRVIAIGVLGLIVAGFFFSQFLPSFFAPPSDIATPTPAPRPPTAIPQPILVTSEDWAQPGYNAEHSNSVSTVFGPLTATKARNILSSSTTYSQLSPPLIIDRLGVFAVENTLAAYDLNDGRRPWGSNLPVVMSGTLAAANNVLIAPVAEGISAVALDSGQVVWTTSLPAGEHTDLVIASDTTSHPIIYAVRGNTLHALAVDGGTVQWTATPVSGTTALRAPIADQQHVFAAADHALVAWNASDGSPAWQAPFPDSVISAPVSAGALVYLRTRKADGSNTLVALDKSGGKQVWAVATLAGEASPPAVDDHIIVVGGDREVAAYDSNTGALLWQQGAPDVGTRNDALVAAAPLLTGEHVYVASTIGKLFAFDRATGLKVTSTTLSIRLITLRYNPVLAHGNLYVLADSGALYEIAHP